MQFVSSIHKRPSGDIHLFYSHCDKKYEIHLVKIRKQYLKPDTGIVMKLMGGVPTPMPTKPIKKHSYYRPYVIDLQRSKEFDITPFNDLTRKVAQTKGELFLFGYIKGLEVAENKQ